MRSGPILRMLLAAFLGAHLLFALLPGFFEPWNLRAKDELFRLRSALDAGVPPYDERVVYVELRDADLEALGKPIFDRTAYAELVRALHACEVRVQVHDAAFRAGMDKAGEAALLVAVGSADEVVLGFVAALDRGPSSSAGTPWAATLAGDGQTLPVVAATTRSFRALEARAAGVGFLDLTEDPDGVLRRAPLVARATGGLRPSLSLMAACRYFGVKPEDVIVRPGESITLKAPKGVRDIVIPIDARGGVLIDYLGPWSAMDHISAADVLLNAADEEDLVILRERLRGRVALVADLTTGAGDIGTTALDARYPEVGLHATVLHSILTGRFLQEVPLWQMILLELLLLAGLFVAARRPPTLVFLGGAVGVIAVFLLGSALLFFYAGWIPHLMRPVLMLLTASLLLWGQRYLHFQQQRARLRTAFEAYFPPSLVERYVRNPEALQAGGRRADLTILFSDIVSFAALSEEMTPDTVHTLLSEYFDAMVEVSFEGGGTVDKFIGDGLMVFFGDPEPQADHAERAARTALAMQRRVHELNETWRSQGRPTIEIRVGLNSGPVIVGNMGSKRRMSYTVLGAAVNLAQRMESNAPAGGVLVSEHTLALLDDAFTTEPAGPVTPKGFRTPVATYIVLEAP